MSAVYNCTYFFGDYINVFVYYLIALFLLVLFTWNILKNHKNKLSITGTFFVWLGSLLNLTERFKSGCVVDNFSFFNIFNYNISDVIITFGLVITFIGVFLWVKK